MKRGREYVGWSLPDAGATGDEEGRFALAEDRRDQPRYALSCSLPPPRPAPSLCLTEAALAQGAVPRRSLRTSGGASRC